VGREQAIVHLQLFTGNCLPFTSNKRRFEMLGNHISWSFHVPGTLAANVGVRFAVPVDCRVVHISAVASNDSDATMMVGVSADTDSILAATAIGDSGVPAVFERGDWASANETAELAKGDIAVLSVDYDGSSGTAAADLTVVLTALEG
jgi:hypothetical protein